MGLYSGQPLIKDWYDNTFWSTFRDYWHNTKVVVSQWAEERDSDVGRFISKWKLIKKLS